MNNAGITDVDLRNRIKANRSYSNMDNFITKITISYPKDSKNDADPKFTYGMKLVQDVKNNPNIVVNE